MVFIRTGHTLYNSEELMSKTISFLRFPLTVGVVFIHFDLSRGLDVGGVVHGMNNPDWYFFIINLLSGSLASISVPLFFFISGFLFFFRTDFNKTVFKEKLRHRVKTLFVPYLLWNLIAILWQFKCFLPGISSFYPPIQVHWSLLRVFNTLFFNVNGIFISTSTTQIPSVIMPIDGPLWYVRDLMLMVILSPLIFWIIKWLGFWFVAIEGLAWFFSILVIPNGSYFGVYLKMLVIASFFFSLGSYFSINKINFLAYFRKFKYAPFLYVGVVIVDALTKGATYNIYLHKVGILLGMISFVTISSYLLEFKKAKLYKTLSDSSFFIFALHYLIITNIGKFLFILLNVPDNSPIAMLILYFFVPVVTILLCLSIYLLLKRYMPKVCSILTGGR